MKKNEKKSLTDDFRGCIYMLVKIVRQPVLQDLPLGFVIGEL